MEAYAQIEEQEVISALCLIHGGGLENLAFLVPLE
jgi:hypothetical protein